MNNEGYAVTMNRGNIIIGNDVWLGQGCKILAGSRIGDGAVIGAGSVVAGKIPPYAIVIGNPLKNHQIPLSFLR